MNRRKFKLQHLFFGAIGLLIVEAIIVHLSPMLGIQEAVVLISSVVGVIMTLYVSIEAIEEVRSQPHLLVFLSLIMAEFIAFFAFEYWYLIAIQPASFPTLGIDTASLLLHSTMIFIFNPLYLPGTTFGRVILLINTFGALFLVLFILQNIWQLRGRDSLK